MGINIFEITPTVVSRDLSGKSFLIYGERKSGKTTNATKFPKPFLMGFEKGYSMLSGVMAIAVNDWRTALDYKKQLIKDADRVAAERAAGKDSETFYKTVIVDTADIAYDCCEKYILDLEGVSNLDETVNMRGYRKLSREYDKFFQEIVKAGYTLVIISHATSKQLKEGGEKYDKTIPTLPNRGFEVVARLVDVCAYASFDSDPETGRAVPTLTLRGNKNLEAGSRNSYMSDKIPFTYDALRDDMAQAIDKMEEAGYTVVDTPTTIYKDTSEKVNFKQVVAEIGMIAKKLNTLDKELKEAGEEQHFMSDYRAITTNYIGTMLVKECTESQSDMLALILDDLKDYLAENKIA